MSKRTEGRQQAGAGERRRWLRPRSLVLLLGCTAMLAAAGCTTLQAVDRQATAEAVEPGETVLVTTRDGRELELAFGDWTSEGLSGTDAAGILQRIGNDDIARVEVQRVSMLRSAGVVAVVLGVAVAAAGDASGVGY